jgi:hypothetical protein
VNLNFDISLVLIEYTGKIYFFYKNLIFIY